jgi:hypothetical protein
MQGALCDEFKFVVTTPWINAAAAAAGFPPVQAALQTVVLVHQEVGSLQGGEVCAQSMTAPAVQRHVDAST